MARSTVGLSTHIWNNNLRCILILVLYPLLIIGLFWLASLLLGGGMSSNTYGSDMSFDSSVRFANKMAYDFWPLLLTGVAIWFTIAWFFHTKMIRKLAHSHPVSRQEEPELYNLLENLCISRGIPMPRLEIIETHARNAFASGVSKDTYAVTVTRGLMHSLATDELEAVLAHELTHIENRDVRLLIVTVIFTGLFGFLAQMVWSGIRYNLFFTAGRREKNGFGVVMAMIVIAVVLWLGYMASLLMRFALSRRREYMADAGAVEMTKNPDAMMRALMRIAGRDKIPGTTNDIAMMCIENHVPFLGVFATHPPIDKRIQAISSVTNTPVPDANSLPPIAKSQSFGADRSRKEKRVNPWLIRERRR